MVEGVDHTELGHPISQKTKVPLAPALRGLRADQTDQLRFLLPVELAVVFAAYGLALNAAGKATLAEAPSDPRDRTGEATFSAPAVWSSAQAGPFGPSSTSSNIYLKQNANARLLGGRALPTPEAFEEIGSLLFGQFNAVRLVGQGLLGMAPENRHSRSGCQQSTRQRSQIYT